MTSHHHPKNQHFSHSKTISEPEDDINNQASLDKTFEKMEKLAIPADLFGNINPNWRIVMKKYYDAETQDSQLIQIQYEKALQKIGNHCQKKYASDKQQLEDCHEQAQLRVLNHFQKPKDLSEILLCNFANKCLIRGNSVQFCTEQIMKERAVINRECFKRLDQINEFL